VPKGFGFTLQNRGHNFRLDPDHPNKLEPRKRPYHTIIPALVTKPPSPKRRGAGGEVGGRGESLYASYGVMGGFMQPQGHVQVLSALVDHGLDPQSALDLPRFCIDVEESGGGVALEEGIPVDVVSELQNMRHPVYAISGYERSLFGRGQVILRDAETSVLCAGSDPRADGCAMTL
jgi:gamma-glutamyltranspeptidase/glutathione hydrolase